MTEAVEDSVALPTTVETNEQGAASTKFITPSMKSSTEGSGPCSASLNKASMQGAGSSNKSTKQRCAESSSLTTKQVADSSNKYAKQGAESSNETTKHGASSSTETAVVASLKSFETTKVSRFDRQFVSDDVSVEEPLEIRLETMVSGDLVMQQIAVTMRTPGNDRELAAGFLFTEGIVSQADDIEEIVSEKCNVVSVRLNDRVEINPAVFERHSFVASSCGICGKKSIAAVRVKQQYASAPDAPIISASTIHGLSEALRVFQDNFNHTGGIHASSLFDTDGKLLNVKEDVGRHNALDKVIGAEFLSGGLPLSQRILMVSGRTSFELVQKAAHAGIAVIAAVGAPSSLAVELAKECGITLIGFMRDDRFNVYSGLHRITDLPEQQ